MPSFGPISRNELIRYLRQFHFEGPYSSGRHQFMIKGNHTPSAFPIPIRRILAENL